MEWHVLQVHLPGPGGIKLTQTWIIWVGEGRAGQVMVEVCGWVEVVVRLRAVGSRDSALAAPRGGLSVSYPAGTH